MSWVCEKESKDINQKFDLKLHYDPAIRWKQIESDVDLLNWWEWFNQWIVDNEINLMNTCILFTGKCMQPEKSETEEKTHVQKEADFENSSKKTRVMRQVYELDGG